MKKFVTFAVVMLLLVMLFGCQGDNASNTIEGIPSIDQFSEIEYGEYSYSFPKIKEAIHQNGKERTEIATDDPRLICLLNMLSYSFDEGLTGWRQGFVYEDEIKENLSNETTLLKIVFETEEGQPAKEMYVIGDQYIIAENKPAPGEDRSEGWFGEQFWPFYDTVRKNITGNENSHDWGSGAWFDLLDYVGF